MIIILKVYIKILNRTNIRYFYHLNVLHLLIMRKQVLEKEFIKYEKNMNNQFKKIFLQFTNE